ncbi:hypothetical protein CAOG_01006 [Capsaspora owczarzaki ATCC 30864]|uniref:hypothetical protein n=1 Tax=Capsaspora owczarzaki (strain ATCC 30864) TaxID=595528 RepID=UPI0003521CB0|nr:hypothetical protein CAOG_01006 [Capsaspora owczarzaki ATCC 30864]|eukprot:XP_004365877.2 hypothetical protein CAOG_01006 [Capsaspora owczarzaki ATCC 30864]
MSQGFEAKGVFHRLIPAPSDGVNVQGNDYRMDQSTMYLQWWPATFDIDLDDLGSGTPRPGLSVLMLLVPKGFTDMQESACHQASIDSFHNSGLGWSKQLDEDWLCAGLVHYCIHPTRSGMSLEEFQASLASLFKDQCQLFPDEMAKLSLNDRPSSGDNGNADRNLKQKPSQSKKGGDSRGSAGGGGNPNRGRGAGGSSQSGGSVIPVTTVATSDVVDIPMTDLDTVFNMHLPPIYKELGHLLSTLRRFVSQSSSPTDVLLVKLVFRRLVERKLRPFDIALNHRDLSWFLYRITTATNLDPLDQWLNATIYKFWIDCIDMWDFPVANAHRVWRDKVPTASISPVTSSNLSSSADKNTQVPPTASISPVTSTSNLSSSTDRHTQLVEYYTRKKPTASEFEIASKLPETFTFSGIDLDSPRPIQILVNSISVYIPFFANEKPPATLSFKLNGEDFVLGQEKANVDWFISEPGKRVSSLDDDTDETSDQVANELSVPRELVSLVETVRCIASIKDGSRQCRNQTSHTSQCCHVHR